jgi:hypothetical protein
MKKILLYLSFIFTALSINAQVAPAPVEEMEQPDPIRAQRIKALYVAYITQELNLTSDEAQKFWPIHAQYETELRAIKAEKKDELDKQQSMLNVKKKYQPSFVKVVGADRCNNFFKLHDGFKRKMFDRLKELKQKKHHGENKEQRENRKMKQENNGQ